MSKPSEAVKEASARAGFCEPLLYHALAADLRTGHMTTLLNGSIVSEPAARRMVAYARAQGWLGELGDAQPPPEQAIG
jgi:hypothetical protein